MEIPKATNVTHNNTRFSMCNQLRNLDKVVDQVANIANKNKFGRYLSPCASSSYFAILSDRQIMLRASLMGEDTPSDSFEPINLIRKLEVTRDSLHTKSSMPSTSYDSLYVDHSNGK